MVDAGFGELRRMLAYKCAWYGGERVYRCAACGIASHRDVNAARNLVWWAEHRSSLPDRVAGSAPETESARGAAERSGLSGTATWKREPGPSRSPPA